MCLSWRRCSRLSWLRHNNDGGAGSGCHCPTRVGETPEPAKQRAFAGLRRGLLFENRMQKMRNPACASFFAVAKQAHSVPHFYFRFFSLNRIPLYIAFWLAYILVGE